MVRSVRPMRRFACTLLLLAGAGTAQAQTMESSHAYSGPERGVPEGPSGTDLVVIVDGLGSISDVDLRLDALAGCSASAGNAGAAVTHAAVGDLTLTLISPTGTEVLLFDRRAGQRDNLCATLFDDDGGFPSLGTLSSTSGQTVSGNFAPDNPLSAFDGESPNGDWRLRVADRATNGVTGTARRYSLVLRTSPPAEILVDRLDDPAPDGCTPGSCSLREAVNVANERPGFDRIVLPTGTVVLNRAGADEDANLTGDLDALASVEIVGAGAQLSLIQQNSGDRVLQASAGVHLRKVGLQGGRGVIPGGAVQGAGFFVIEDAAFLGNSAERGGALYHWDAGHSGTSLAELTLRRVRFERNEVTSTANRGEGGAVSAGGGSYYRAVCEACTFVDNLASDRGGAIYFSVEDGELTLRDSEFSRNQLTEGGGGGAISTSPAGVGGLRLTIERSRFIGNLAVASPTSSAGAIAVGPPSSFDALANPLTITDSTFCENRASSRAGAILTVVETEIAGSTFCNNQVTSTDAGGDDVGGGAIAQTGSFLRIVRSTLVGNTAPRGGAIVVFSSAELDIRSSTLTAATFNPVGTLGSLLRYNPTNAIPELSLYNNVLIGSCSYANAGIVPDVARNNIEASNDTCRLGDATVSIGNQLNASTAAVDLAPLADNGGPTMTRLPRSGSLAIDEGSNATCPALDQRGYARGDAFCDIGAVEADGTPSSIDVFADGFE
jgi:subtilisin-like proprotein convertase family protein